MPTEFNRGRARVYYDQLRLGDQDVFEWIKLIIPILMFLLARYIDGE